MRSVIHLHRYCENTKSGQVSEGNRWFASSLSVEQIGKGQRLAEMIRGHWSIEKRNHWHRDANLKEDQSRCRTPALARALAVLRGPVLTLAKSTNHPMPALFLAHTRHPAKALKLISTPRKKLN